MSYPGLSPSEVDRRVAEVVNRLLAGKMNAVTTVTLTAGATSTTLTDSRIGGGSWIGLSPTTANAAGALATTYISAKAKGSATITHANDANVDKTFDVLIIG